MNTRLIEFDYLRGLSIFLIVWGHMTQLLGEYKFVDNYAEFSKMLTLTVQGNTAIFVFISGFMFYWVYYRRCFQYKEFLRKKFNNIFRPYFCIATIFTFIHFFYGVYSSRWAQWHPLAENEFQRILLSTYMYWSYWYVPFIAIVFVASPIYIKFLEARRSRQVLIMIFAFIASCFLGRKNLNPFWSCAYFSIYYLFGIFCAQNYERIRNFSIKFWIRLLWFYLMTVLFFSIAGVFCFGLVHLGIIKNLTDLNPIFKVPECLLLLWAANNLTKLSVGLKKILNILAEYSFAIFFLHNFFIAIFEETSFLADMEIPCESTAIDAVLCCSHKIRKSNTSDLDPIM